MTPMSHYESGYRAGLEAAAKECDKNAVRFDAESDRATTDDKIRGVAVAIAAGCRSDARDIRALLAAPLK
jgi:hypothetical protein